MEVEELRHRWKGTQLYDTKIASDLWRTREDNKYNESHSNDIYFYCDNPLMRERQAFCYYKDIDLEFDYYRKSFGPWWKSFNSKLRLRRQDEIPKQLYKVHGPTTWVKEEYKRKWVQCWTYDMNSAYPAACCDKMPDIENEIPFPGLVESGECGFITDNEGYLIQVREGELASYRFPLKESPLKPWFDKLFRQKKEAKRRGDNKTVEEIKLKMNSVIGMLRNHNVFLYLYFINRAKENVEKYIDSDTIAVNVDCIYSRRSRTDIPLSDNIGDFKEGAESGNEIYFRDTNYAWRDSEGRQFAPHMKGIPKILQETYNIESGKQERNPDYCFNEQGELVEWEVMLKCANC